MHNSVGAQFHDPPLCEMFCTETEWRRPIYRKLFGTFLFIMQYIVPLIVIAASYGIIAYHFNAGSLFYKRVSAESARSAQHQRSFDRRKRTNRMLASMVAMFAITSAPLAFINLLNDFDANPEFLQRQKYFVTAVGHLCAALSISIDPILYVIMNRKFHDVVSRTIMCKAKEKVQKLSTPRYLLTIHFHSPSIRPGTIRMVLEKSSQKLTASKNN